MIRLAGLGHLGLRVRNLDVAVHFYTDVMGLACARRSEGHAWLGLGGTGHCLYLVEEEGPPLHHLAFALRPGQKVDLVADTLRAAGISVIPGPCEPGPHGETIQFSDPDGQAIELFEPMAATAETAGRRLRPDRLQHMVLQTPEVERAAAFYAEQMGFRISDWMGRKFVWLRCGTDHHDLGIVYAPTAGLDHYAYEIADWQEIKRWSDLLCRQGIRLLWGPGRHGPGNNLFIMFPDSEGNRIELSCEMEQFHDDAVSSQPREWHDVTAALNLWGPGPTWRA
jgi:catechol 2,3-dioxygenase-like lactoylglutathione lyase family enzyme